MIKIDSRESAHVKSRVKDESVVPNIASFNGLFACITPISRVQKNSVTNQYDPILVRDVDTLIANFGDPRIDPEKYVDLYSIMQLVANGGTCWVAKVDSGDAGVYEFPFVNDQLRDTEEDLSDHHPVPESGEWKITGLRNKYVIKRVTGSTNTDSLTPDLEASSFYTLPFTVKSEVEGEPDDVITNSADMPAAYVGNIDYTDYFTYKCEEHFVNGISTFDLVITLNLPDSGVIPEPTNISVEGAIDESWGVENIPLAVDSTDTKKYTATKLSSRYVITSFADVNDSDSPTVETPVEPENVVWSQDLDGTWSVTVTLRDALTSGHILVVKSAARAEHCMVAYSSMAEDLQFNCELTKTKPYSLNVYYLNVTVKDVNNSVLASSRIKISDPTVTNQSIVNNLNSALGTVIRFELMDPSTANACAVKEDGLNSLAVKILHDYSVADGGLSPSPFPVIGPVTISNPSFVVNVTNYVNALNQYKDKKYNGRLMADLVCPVNTRSNSSDPLTGLYALNYEDRRTLHYYMKEIASERKDTTVILSTPYYKEYGDLTPMEMTDACNWVASQGDFVDLWEYGQTDTEDYATQSFYLEMYWSWLEMTCTKIVNGSARNVKVKVAPTNLVMNNILTSWRNRGVQFPVAGDQGGVLPDTVEVLQNPKTKLERDQLVQYRINPIWDTGTRGVQIFGNETLNAGYTDLNAAHIARLLVWIRSEIDEYTETLKFSINSLVLWDKWKTYVSQYILDPLVSSNALSEYMVQMGEDTTSREEIANRKINGIIRVIFYQSAEIFDLSYVIYSSSTTIEEAMANT
jgi:hypothetical protein